jgi:hypothetical protein
MSPTTDGMVLPAIFNNYDYQEMAWLTARQNLN